MLLSHGTLVVLRDTQLDKLERAILMIEKGPIDLRRRQETLLAALKREREKLRRSLALAGQLAQRRPSRNAAEAAV